MSLALCASCWVSSLQYNALAVAGARAPLGCLFFGPSAAGSELALRTGIVLVPFFHLPALQC
jgi:hypothetical protein